MRSGFSIGKTRAISLGFLFLGLLGLALFFLLKGEGVGVNQAAGGERGAFKVGATAGGTGSKREKSGETEGSEGVQREDSTVFAAEQKLRDLENKRFSFTRQYEDEEKVGFEFKLAAPSKEEQLEISRICSEVKGFVPKVRQELSATWAARLREDYLYEGDYEEFEVTVFFYKESGEGSYVVMGKKRGGEGGFGHLVRSAPEFGGEARFSYLLDFKDDPGK